MKDKTDQLIQVYNNEGEEIGIFKFTGNNCPEDYLQTVLRDYFEYNDDENANMHLFTWGLQRVCIEHEIIIN